MYLREETFEEIKKFAPKKKENEGTVLINLDIYYPYGNWKQGHSVEVAFMSPETAEPYDTLDSLFPKDIAYIHQYPNKCFYSLSKKQGRNTCKAGYPIVAPIEEINSNAFMILRIRGMFKTGETMYFMIPVQFSLTKNKNICKLDIVVNYVCEKEKFAISISSSKCENNKRTRNFYVIGNPPKDRYCLPFGDTKGQKTKLEMVFNKGTCVVMGPMIKLYSQTEEKVEIPYFF